MGVEEWHQQCSGFTPEFVTLMNPLKSVSLRFSDNRTSQPTGGRLLGRADKGKSSLTFRAPRASTIDAQVNCLRVGVFFAGLFPYITGDCN